MLRFPTDVGHCSPCANTASAALMKGWINSIFISSPRARSVSRSAILAHDVLDHFVQDFRLHRFLHEMTCAALQCRHDVLLISDGGNHDNARVGMLLHNLLGSFDPLHLGHGDVHQHDVRLEALIFGYGGHAIPGFACNLATECFNHPGQILACEDGIVHYQVANWLTVLTALDWYKLLHIQPPAAFKFRHRVLACRREFSSCRLPRPCRYPRTLSYLRPSDHSYTGLAGYWRAPPGPPLAPHSRVRWPPSAYRKPRKTPHSGRWSFLPLP